MTVNGTMREPFTLNTMPSSFGVRALTDVEKEVGRLAQTLRPGDDKPEPVTGRMQDVAESSALQVEQSAEMVMKMAEAVATEGRELAATIRKGAEAYEARVAAFAEFARGVTVNIRQAATDASTFAQAADA